MKELLLGCGHNRRKQISLPERHEWTNLVTLDIDPDSNADVIHDLNVLPYPFEDEEFDEIHAYEVMEHVGTQGDWRFFFAQFTELARILKPEGFIMISSPKFDSQWAWGDPGHTRIIGPEQLGFLNQQAYEQVGKTTMTDYRWVWKADLRLVHVQSNAVSNFMILQKWSS